MFEAPFFAFLGAFVLNLFLTPYLIRRLRRMAVLDIPNERSSHEVPVPRGAGLVIVTTWILGMIATWALRFPLPKLGILAPDGFVVATTAGMTALALLGFADDRLNLNPVLKLVVQLGVAFQALWLSGLRVQDFGLPPDAPLSLGQWGWLISLVWLVGFTNIFNFMDGINGLAFTQLIVGGTAFCLMGVRAADYELALSGALAAGSAFGVLKYNFPRALVFMGDVGSLPSGFLLAMLGLRAAFGMRHGHDVGFLVPLVVLWPFLYDGGFTLLNRMLHGRNPIRPHRSHLYQRLIVLGLSHARITTGYGGWMVVCATAGFVLPTLPWVTTRSLLVALVAGSVIYTALTVRRVRADMT